MSKFHSIIAAAFVLSAAFFEAAQASAMNHLGCKMKKLAIALSCAMTVAAAPSANAASVTYDQIWSFPNPVNVNLQQFDSTLGTLTGVELTLNAHAVVIVVGADPFGSDPRHDVNGFTFSWGPVTNTIGITSQTPDASTTSVSVSSPGGSWTLKGLGTFFTFVIDDTASASVTVPSLDFAAYEGLGTFAVLATDVFSPYATYTPLFATYEFETPGSGDVSVTYNYDALSPSATPLPAAFPLFATGLGLMGLLGWRRKRRSSRMPTT
jgi:hypothetical protein